MTQNKVEIKKYGQSHNIAQCLVCYRDWDLFHHPKLYNEMLKHVRKTGHKVVRESNSTTYYSRMVEK